MPTKSPYSRSTRRAIKKYGIEACERAFVLNSVYGEGAMLIGGYGKGCTARGDAMIDAGREISRVTSGPLAPVAVVHRLYGAIGVR